MTEPTTERHVFIADVHLRREETAKRDALLRYMSGLARPGVHLHLLGDLFDVWIGSAQLEAEPELVPVIEAMKDFTRAGGRLAFFHGNRDFYMGGYLTRNAGAETVRGSKIIDLDGRKTYLSHGELLCGADQLHQFVRRLLQSPLLVAVFHLFPLHMKYGSSRAYRGISLRVGSRHRSPRHGISRYTLRRLMRRGVEVIICGHLHEPSDRIYRHGGREARLIVLPPWLDRGSALEYANGTFTMRTIDFA